MPADQRLIASAATKAIEWHGTQSRKSTDIPYISHLFAVAALVLEHGGTAAQAAAGLLHDAVEDTPATVTEIRQLFGDEVAAIVEACTDTAADDTPRQKSAWEWRKATYVERMGAADEAAALVAACDKRHNLGTIVAEVRHGGRQVFARFTAPEPKQLWYYAELVKALAGKIPHRLQAELERLLAELHELLPDVEPWAGPGADDAPVSS